MYDLLVKNGVIVSENSEIVANLAIKDGKVVAILDQKIITEAKNVIDAKGKYILPGMIDPHVHAGHGTPDRETFYHASMACAAGGITTMVEQPLSVPSTITLEAFENKKIEADKESIIDFALWGGLVPGHFDDIEPVFNAGGQAMKSFMCRCSNYPMTDDGTLLKGMRKIGELGGLVAVHAENDTLINQLVEDLNQKGQKDVEAFLDSHPIYSELEAIKRFIFIAKQAPKCKAHIVHVSIPEGIRAIQQAKEEGINITVETCPQYLGLSEDDLRKLGGVAKCDPPVRSQELVNELWNLVIDGSVDMIASDHSPHSFNRKIVDKNNFTYASEGVTGLQTMIPVVLTYGVNERGMKLSQLVKLCSTNVSKRFGLYPQKGALEIGSDADFLILNLKKEWECKAENMYYLNKHTPFDGRIFKGYIEKTFLRGNLIYENNEIKVNAGFGNFIKLDMTK